MTFPVSTVHTVPYCGSCGRETLGPWAYEDLAKDLICDGCGADLLAFGWAGLIPPTALSLSGDDPLAGDVSVTFVADPGADSTDLRWGVNVDPVTVITGVTSVFVLTEVVTGAVSTDKVSIQLRSVVNAVPGPWSTVESVTIA